MTVRRGSSPWGLGGSSRISALSISALLIVPSIFLRPGTTAGAQEPDRIWGRVETASGRVYEGYIRWDGKEGSWVDLLNGSKERSREAEELWRGVVSRDQMRVVELSGFRISWDDRDYPETALSGIRFGHLRRLIVLEDQRVELELKSGESVVMEGGGPPMGNPTRVINVETPEQEYVGFAWADLAEICFGPALTSHQAEGTRLHGTVEDRFGDRYTGYISWNWVKILTTDLLRGEEDDPDQQIPFGRIAAIEKGLEGSRVFLTDGEQMFLSGSRDVDEGNLGIQISDPGLGVVEVKWGEFSAVRFHEPEAHVGYDAFDGGHRLRGTVFTQAGEEFTGRVVWDADETYSWELLDGEGRDIVYDIEFGKIATIERDSSRGVLVTLLDGRVIELEGSNDVKEENRGIFIQVDDQANPRIDGWVLVSWDDFRRIRFHH